MTYLRISRDVRSAGQRDPKEAFRRGPLRTAFIAAWRRNWDLLGTASTLAATTGVTAALGFVYWAVAARLFSQQAVGYGAAAVSAMTLLGTIGMLGLGTVLIGELPRRSPRVGLVAAALLASGLGSLVLGMTFAVLAPYLSDRFREISGAPGRAALFAAGVVLIAVSLVFDQAAVGMMRGGLQLSRNVIFAIAKLLALPVAAVILHAQVGVGITASWIVGVALSMALLALQLRFIGTPVVPRPDWAVLRGLGRTALAHNWLNLASTLPLSLIPVLVTVVVSPTANAAFYAAWTLCNFLRIVPTHLGTVLFAVTSGDPKLMARKLRFTLRLSLLIGLPGMVILGMGAHQALALFGASYASQATLPLRILVISYLPIISRAHYMAVCRATGHIPRAAAVMTAAVVMEVTAAVVGGTSDGLKGLSVALLAVYIVEGLVTTPPVLRAAIGRGSHRCLGLLPASANGTRPCGTTPDRAESHRPWRARSSHSAGTTLSSLGFRHERLNCKGSPGGSIEIMTLPTLADATNRDRREAKSPLDHRPANGLLRLFHPSLPARGRHRRAFIGHKH